MKAKRVTVRRQEYERLAARALVLDVSPILAALNYPHGCNDELTARTFLTPSYQVHHSYLMRGLT